MKSLRKEIKETGLALGICIMYPSAGIIERIGADWDWIWIDWQHGELDYISILELVRACDLISVPAVIRVPDQSYGSIGLALDTGASGVMVPMVNNVEDAKNIVKAAKFPPSGNRSFGSRRLIDLYGRSYAHTANDDTTLIAQIENSEGLENVERIAAVDGIDAIFFGPDDFAMEKGIPMDNQRKPDLFAREMERVVKAASSAGKLAGTVAASPEMLDMAFDMGYRLFVCASDVGLIAAASEQIRQKMDHVIEGY